MFIQYQVPTGNQRNRLRVQRAQRTGGEKLTTDVIEPHACVACWRHGGHGEKQKKNLRSYGLRFTTTRHVRSKIYTF